MQRSHRVLAIGLVLVLVAAVVAIVVVRSNTSESTASVAEPTSSESPDPAGTGDPQPEPTPEQSTGSTQQPEGDPQPVTRAPVSPEEAERAALSTIDGYLATSVALLSQPAGPSDPLAVYAAGEALSEIQNQALQFDEEGIRVSGRSRVDGAAVTGSELAADPATVTITACVDDTGITVYTPEAPQGVASAQRTRTIFVVAYSDGQWKVTARSFANEASC